MSDVLSLNLEMAERAIDEYAGSSERLTQDHAAAMEARDCEDLLRAGVMAYHAVSFVERVLREADYRGIAEYGSELRASVLALYRDWLLPCERVEAWVADLNGRGYDLDGFEEFRSMRDEVSEIVQRFEWNAAAKKASDCRWAAETADEPEARGAVRS